MKTLLFVIIFIVQLQLVQAQSVIIGRSKPFRVNLGQDYKKGIPPNLSLERLLFMDDNKNGILEANESGSLELIIANKGKGIAQGLRISIEDNQPDDDLRIMDGMDIGSIEPGKSDTVVVMFKAGMNLKSADHKFSIRVKEYFGYDMDPAYLMLNTYAFQHPQLAFSGFEIKDSGTGTASIIADGKLQPGEMVKVKLYVQNIGQNISKETYYNITCESEDISISDCSGKIGDILIGEVREIWFTLSPNKRVNVKDNLPIRLSLTNESHKGEIGNFSLPIAVNQNPPGKNIHTVEPKLEQLKAQIAKYEVKYDKMPSRSSNLINIHSVAPSKTKRPNAIGIVIGLENYDNCQPAPYADNDADVMKEYFKDVLGIDRVYEYKDDDVIGLFFDNIFNPDYGSLQKSIVKDTTEVFVYYSGHGWPSKDGSKIFLMTHDGRKENIDKQGYAVNTLFQSLDSMKAKSVTVIMDACFTGMSRSNGIDVPVNLTASKGIRIVPDVDEPWLNNPNFTFFSSSTFDQTSLGYADSETGLLTYYLCAGLQGKADANEDKKITNGELFDYIFKQVTETSKKISGLQSPQFNGDREKVLVSY